MRAFRFFCLFGLLSLLLQPVSAADKFRRIAVMPFENTTRDKTVDWLGGGIAETLTTELGRISDFTLVERNRLNDALKEIKLGQSAAVDAATAQRMGKILGADSIVVGSFQKVMEDVRVQARIIDVETGQVRAPARVDGKDILQVQVDIATKLVMEMKGSVAEAEKKKLESLPSKNVDALQALSDGAYFLRSDLTEDALKEFERAIMLDPNFTEAHYYKGVALAKLKRWDDAITALKRTLPRVQNEQRVKWSWDAPFELQGSQRGLIIGRDSTAWRTDGPMSDEQSMRARRQLIYTERSGKNTLLYFLDFARRNSTRVEIPDDKVPVDRFPVNATDRIAIIPAASPDAAMAAGKISLYGVSPDGGVLWHTELVGETGKRPPAWDLRGQTLFEFFSDSRRIVAVDAETLQPRWERTNISSTNFETKGNLALVTSPSDKKIHAIRFSDGQDAWTVDYASISSAHLVTDQALVVFEPERRVFAIELSTGKVIADIATPPLMNNNLATVPSLIDDNVLYFASNANELQAIDLNPVTPANRRLRWKTPLQVKIGSLLVHGTQVYASGENGDFLIIDKAAGSIRTSKKVVDTNLYLSDVDDEVVLANTNATVFAFDPKTGNKLWDHASVGGEVRHLKGVVLITPVIRQFAALDVVTGNILWQNTGNPVNTWVDGDSLFVLEQGGVKEYAFDRTAAQGITNKEAMTELASVLVSKGDVDEASRFADRVAKESDPNYPPLRYVQARIQQARGNANAALRELVIYTNLAGRQSKAGQDVVTELKQKNGLIWQAETGAGISSICCVDNGKIIGLGDSGVAAVDAANGKLLWRQRAERLLDAFVDDTSKRVFYAYRDATDPKVVHVYVIGIDGVNRKEFIRLTTPYEAGLLNLAQAGNRLFVATAWRELQSGKITLRITAFTGDSGTRVWERIHEYGAQDANQIQVTLGLFYPRSNFLVYSQGRDMWVVQGEDGAVYAEDHENAPIRPKRISVQGTGVDPDTTFFAVGGTEVVAYRLSTKQVISRVKMPAQDARFATNAGAARGTTIFGLDGSSIIAVDVGAGVEESKRLQWRAIPKQGERYTGYSIPTALEKTSFIALRRDDAQNLTFVEIDINTGKVLREFQPLWAPNNVRVVNNSLYVFTPDGLAYSMKLNEN